VFYDVATGKDFLLNEETLDHIQNLFAKHGSDCWWTMDETELLPEKYRDEATKWKKGTDTMDVWFDSGSSWAGVAQSRKELTYPADIYLEGSDQHRGWFQSSLLTSVASNKLAPYKTVLTHGFVLDEKGFKMSKSLGNVVDPMKVVNGGSNKKTEPAYGADVLRLWVANSDYSGDVGIGDNIIKQTFESYRKLRNTARYLIGNLADFVPEGHEGSNAVAYQDLPSLDKWMLGQLSYVLRTVDEAIDQYQFQKAVQEIMRFASADLSNFYLDVAKDRLYISAIDDKRRRSCQTVIDACLEGFAKAISPLLPHMAEDIWQNLPYERATKSVFEGGWPSHLMNFPQTDTRDWELVLKLRDDVNKMLEVVRADKIVGASMEAAAYIYFENADEREILSKLIGDADLVSPPVKTNGVDELRTVLMLSEVHLVENESDISNICDTKYVSSGPTFSGCTIGIKKASGQKCARCWFYDNSIGKHSLPHSDACQRCNDAVASWEEHFGNPFVRPVAETEPAIEPVV
jgi:isoleucyl-tRNA synthetase